MRVRNQGTVSARNVEVTAFAPPELRPTSRQRSGAARIDAAGKVIFPPVEEMRPGQTVTFTIEVEAMQAATPGSEPR